MKDSYKISEIARLYDIGVDSLRYYERLGILQPRRDSNGYRLYNLTDMYKLNMIRDLRRLDFSMAQIKSYLEGQTVAHTLDLLCQEQALVHTQMQELETKAHLLQKRITTLQNALTIQPGVMTTKTLPARPCVQLSQHITRDEEMDFVMKKLHRKHEDKLRDFGNQIFGAFLSMEELMAGTPNVYDGVFSVLEEDPSTPDFVLPAGVYLSYFYRGSYEQNRARVQELLSYAGAHGFHLTGTPFELYEIDNRDTVQEEEFLTEIQVAITAPAERTTPQWSGVP